MDFDDLFDFDRDRRRGKNEHRDYEDGTERDEGRYHKHDDHLNNQGHDDVNDRWRNRSDHHYGHQDDELFDLSHLMPRLLANKKLLILAGVVLLAVIALAIIFVLPLLGPLADKSGLRDAADRVWQGTAGGK